MRTEADHSSHSIGQKDIAPEGIRSNEARSPRRPRARFAPEYEVLLQKLIAARQKASVTQSAMAQALGKTQSHVSMCENRERELSIVDIWKWCLVIGMNFSDFVLELEKEITPALGHGEK